MHLLITGANRGLGLELTRQYAAQPDHTIYATCRQPSSADALQSLVRASDSHVLVFKLDVTQADDIAACVNSIQNLTDRLDLLINNAGVFQERSRQTLDAITPQMMLRELEVNAVAPLFVARAFRDLLRASDRARLVNVSSQLGSLSRKTTGGGYAYSTSKAALNMVTRALAADLAGHGVTTIALHPGWVQTDMGGQAASLTPQEAVAGIIRVVDGLTPQDNGRFLRWDGSEHAW